MNTSEFLDAVLHGEGWLCIPVGHGGHWSGGKYTFDTFVNGNWYAWPSQRTEAAEFIAASEGDVYFAPYLMKSKDRAAGNAVTRQLVHADVDGELDEQMVSELGGGAVASGRPGHLHVYVPLTYAVTAAQHRRLCEALRDKLGGDDKIADNDLLRVAGTLNRKTDPPGAVEVLWWPAEATDPRALAEKLGVDISTVTEDTIKAPAAPQTTTEVDLSGYPTVAAALEIVSGDRSGDTHRIVAACAEAGLDLSQTRWVVRSRDDLRARLDGRRDDDIANSRARWESSASAKAAAIFANTAKAAEPPAPDGADVLNKIAAWLRRFIVFTADTDADLVTLWAAHTHLATELRSSPRLHIDSITFGSGKTTLLEHLERLCLNGVTTAGTSAAVIPRLVSSQMTSVLFDEVNRTLSPGKEGVEDLLAIINTGYRFGAKRLVSVPIPGGGWTAEKLSTFCAVALAGNSPQLPDDTVSRALRVMLMPDNNGDAEDTDWLEIEGDCLELATELAAWADSVRETITLKGVDVPGARGRERERWRTLKAVAYLAGGRWPATVDALIQHGVAETEAFRDAGLVRLPPKLQLLMDLHSTWKGQPEFMPTELLCARLVSENPAFWAASAQAGRGDLTSQRLGKMVADATKQLAALEKSQRPERGGPRGYLRSQFNPTWHRLGLPLHSVQSDQSAHLVHPETADRVPSASAEPSEPSTGEGDADSGEGVPTAPAEPCEPSAGGEGERVAIPGDVTASTPGQTDRVARIIAAAAAKVAEVASVEQPEACGNCGGELTPGVEHWTCAS